ncbi:MAG: hypothetical protein M9949_12605 [Candidatus Kapabacteria bacterium]|nr:hypothetical protein [Candidatus Kapabacteria bacterium]
MLKICKIGISTELQSYRATELQSYRATELQSYRATELQSYRATEERRDAKILLYPIAQNFSTFKYT